LIFWLVYDDIDDCSSCEFCLDYVVNVVYVVA